MDFLILILAGLVCSMGSISDGEQVLGLVGGNVTLKPSVDQSISSITWKRGQDKAAEWDKMLHIDYYTICKTEPRCQLNHSTGELTIMKLKPNEKLNLSAEINGMAAKSFFTVIALGHVSKPSVGINCTNNQCDLVCEGNDKEYTSYYWMENNKAIHSKNLTVYKSDKLDKTYRCEANNILSSEKSDLIREADLFKGGVTYGGITTAIICILIILVAVAGAGILYYKKQACFKNKQNDEKNKRQNHHNGETGEGKTMIEKEDRSPQGVI
ncbi:uncharacterized protein LOC125709963 isoform X2 [Brienomyrus brachyistius]|uniref:uncharacterized protein LOC125709963 isoform X2 n=1 Tax=Brienomyrus brachyistius TaxID=42636 RepID=UPI0020B458B7|nr:uncharacterized protein LOC125709963 isoform X2 [Brienomyrus brachyistius]